MGRKKQITLETAKEFVIRECAPQKKRDRLAKEAAWELYKELYPVEAAEWEAEVQEDDAELEQEEIKIEMEKPSIIQEIINQTKVFGVAGLLGISSGLYFQSQAVYEGTNEIFNTVSLMNTQIAPTNSEKTESSEIVDNESITDSESQGEEMQSIAEEAADNAANSQSESEVSSESESESESKSESIIEAEEPSSPEPTEEAPQLIAEETQEEEESEPVITNEIESQQETKEDFVVEPVIIDVPEIFNIEIPSEIG